MGFSTKHLFSIILIISVIFILFSRSPVYKMISGEGGGVFGMGRLVEGMTSSEAASLGITGDGSNSNPYMIREKLIVRPSDTLWKEKIQNDDKNEIGIQPWGIDNQFKTIGLPHYIGDQYRYFAEWWLAKYNPNATPNISFGANVRGQILYNSASDYGLYTFRITKKNDDGSIDYSGLFNNRGWGWTSAPLSPAPTPIVAPVPTLASYGCKKCQDDMFTCTNLPQSNPLKSGGTAAANSNSLISGYKVDLYDAPTPSYTIEGKDYWWRQGGGCPPAPAPVSSQQSITPFFKVEDAVGIKQGKYNNISFNTFGLNSNLNNWTITIILSAIRNSSKWQGIIGNIYNSQIPGHKDGWGFWISPYNYLHFRIGDTWAQDFTSLGQILGNTPYKIIISFNNNEYKIKLIRMTDDISDNASNIVNISNKPKLTTDKGNICLGGGWENLRTAELFDGNITYVDFMSPSLQLPASASASSLSRTIPNPTSDALAGFKNKKCNNDSTYDGNCYPVCVPIKGGKVVGPPTKVYGGKDTADGPDRLPFDMGTANYFYERPMGGSDSGGEYYPITNAKYSRILYGTDTDCTQNYACSPTGRSNGKSAQCIPPPLPPRPAPRPGGGPCDPSCRKVKDPRLAKGACKLDKSIDKIVCSACPLVDGEINCNNYMATCSGCGSHLTAYIDPDKTYPSPQPKEKPFTPTECEKNCEKPGVQIFQNYLNTFRDGSGFDDGSCQVIGRNMVKCRSVRRGVGMGAGAGAGANGGMKPIPSPDECVLCDEEKLQGYAEFDRKLDNYANQNDYVNIRLIDKPDSRRGASYGPSEDDGRRGGGGGGGSVRKRSGSGNENWQKWDGSGGGGGGNDSANGAGWRGKQTGGWFQSMSDVKNKSFQVATANAKSSQQQAYIESLKLELNKLNDEYTTQKVAVNKMKMDIEKQVNSCQIAKSKLNYAMSSSVSDDMNKNAAITLKEKIDANTKYGNRMMLEQGVKSACDNANQMNNTHNIAMKQLGDIDKKRQVLIEKLVIAMNSATDSKTTININFGGVGGMGDCSGRLGCGTGIEYSNMYTTDFFKPQRIDDMINYSNIPMPYQDIISF